ncbi:TraR/DksA C4-type zinc finger protein [Shewanella sedimentimangrovi]|uniref:TraR/DksA C4-type zinc finger protein n=1 Tax=Shewanella sedimentimangrovi TaxID=2814293 RepID=A0ABX7R6W4_9GAMM|nr:TraR/DksA C4-type zinc finger protein [Shewanella sedimentimangrovi]QSX38543.1 TraR/DksA C4-type zinc finger protein [Shewanella sedimentimangrovi]
MSMPNIRHALSQLEASLREELGNQSLPQVAAIATTAPLSDIINTLTDLHLSETPLFERLLRLDAAWCQLDLGLYGLCADCEEPIEADLLLADPSEQRCATCAEHFHMGHRHELRLNH